MLLAAAALLSASGLGYDPAAVTVVDIAGVQLYASESVTSTDVAANRADAEELPLVAPPPELAFGCNPLGGSGRYAGAAVLVRRGQCFYGDKIRHAVDAGAKAVLVASTLDALYVAPGEPVSMCSFDCDLGQASTEQECASSCGLCGSLVRRGWCCVVDRVLAMDAANSTDVGVPVVSVSIHDGEVLAKAAEEGPVPLRLYSREVGLRFSSWALWALGVFAAGAGSWWAASHHRKTAVRARPQGGQPSGTSEAATTASPDISAGLAACFAAFASCLLIGMYFLVRAYPMAVVYWTLAAFCIGGSLAQEALLYRPLLRRWRTLRKRPFTIAGRESCSLRFLLGWAAGIGVCAVWVICRNLSWAWVLQDCIAVCLCTYVLTSLSLPNVRVAAVLLSLFFVYDVFMVFITPLVFGRSVMMEVATAGGADKEEEGENVCVRTAGQQVAMVFLMPHGSWPGGYSLLGFGDVMLPGMLLTLARRYDYTAAWTGAIKPRVVGYHTLLVAGYAVGLFLAFVANTMDWTVNGVKGQPALLYLVPCTLGVMVAAGWWRGELRFLWRSSPMLPRRREIEEGGGDIPLVDSSSTQDAAERSNTTDNAAEREVSV